MLVSRLFLWWSLKPCIKQKTLLQIITKKHDWDCISFYYQKVINDLVLPFYIGCIVFFLTSMFHYITGQKVTLL